MCAICLSVRVYLFSATKLTYNGSQTPGVWLPVIEDEDIVMTERAESRDLYVLDFYQTIYMSLFLTHSAR